LVYGAEAVFWQLFDLEARDNLLRSYGRKVIPKAKSESAHVFNKCFFEYLLNYRKKSTVNDIRHTIFQKSDMKKNTVA
jgi:hypothetical protein